MPFLPAFTEVLGAKPVICYLEAVRLDEICVDEESARDFVKKSLADSIAGSVAKKVKEFGEVDWFLAFFWTDETLYHPKFSPRPNVDLWLFRLKKLPEKYAEITIYPFKGGGICNERFGYLSSDTLPAAALEEAWRQRATSLEEFLGLRPELSEGSTVPWPAAVAR